MNILSRVRRSPFAFPLAALIALALLFISELSYWQATRSLDRLSRMAAARSEIQAVTGLIVDAETGQRGYLLTGRDEYLAPYRRALSEIDTKLAALRAYYADGAEDPAARAALEKLDTEIRRKLSELGATLRLYNEGKSEAWHTLLLTDIGKEQMDAIRSGSDQLTSAEAVRVSRHRQDIDQTLLLSRIGVGAMTAVSLLALFLYLRQTEALERQRQEQQRAIQAERDHLETEVDRRTRQLTELAQHLQTAREDERSRLARDLHDELGALLTAAKLDAARLRSRIGDVAPEANERLDHLNETLNRGIALKRRIIEDLRPSSLSNLGLVAALEILTREFAQVSGMAVECLLQPVKLAPSGELMVYRLVQEALTNAAKYAQARRIVVRLASTAGEVRVEVRDDGVGFAPDEPRRHAHGLVGMQYRVEAEGGRMELDSAPGRGTLVAAALPEQAAQAPT